MSIKLYRSPLSFDRSATTEMKSGYKIQIKEQFSFFCSCLTASVV